MELKPNSIRDRLGDSAVGGSRLGANSNAREGRVMIYSLVEAAQEFLSEVVPLGQLQVSVSSATHLCVFVISIDIGMLRGMRASTDVFV
ncbi:unnamed protein product [Ilex paraguariensis]|uniref:Uncharacterized protein n=1 Tax=Ilex paraguariensis TaxID=185542 RepID=A0ABC8UA89_9AQUA